MTDDLTPEQEAELEKIATMTKRGFDPKARLQNRGLRKAVITLYLDEEIGPELGWAYGVTDTLGNEVRRERAGIIGELDQIEMARAETVKQYEENIEKMTPVEKTKVKKAFDSIISAFDERTAELKPKRDELMEKLTKTGMTIHMRAVPPVIEKDTKRKAKAMLKIETKNVPNEQKEEFLAAQQAHLMMVMFQKVIDNETGDVNEETTYDDAVAMMEYLPPGQWDRLDQKIGEVQFTDAISRSIESQEDFS